MSKIFLAGLHALLCPASIAELSWACGRVFHPIFPITPPKSYPILFVIIKVQWGTKLWTSLGICQIVEWSVNHMAPENQTCVFNCGSENLSSSPGVTIETVHHYNT